MSVGAEQHPMRTAALRGGRLMTGFQGRSNARMARSPRANDWPRRYAAYLRAADVLVVLSVAACGFALLDGTPRALISLAAVAAAWPAALGIYGSRDHSVLGTGTEEYRRVVTATVHLFAVVAIAVVIFDDTFPARVFLTVFAAGLAGLLGVRRASRHWLDRQRQEGLYLTPAVVVGEAADVRRVVRGIAASESAPYDVLGAILPDGRRGESLAVDGERIPVLGPLEDVLRTVALKSAAAVIIAGPVPGGHEYLRGLGWDLGAHDADLVLASSLTDVAGPHLHWRPVHGLPLMEVAPPHYVGARNMAKRLMDAVLSFAALVLLAPVLAVFALILRLESRGPVILRQERIGEDGTPFTLLNFRSAQDAEAAAGETRYDRWMRRWRLDALPQLVNVARGEMSLVGPRPVGADDLAGKERALIKPGIVEAWQVGWPEVPWDDAARLDLYYVENWSITGDLIILWRTLRDMASRGGARP